MDSNEISIILPNGYAVTVTVPSKLDPELVELAFRALLGGLVAVSQAYTEETCREYLVRFVASIMKESDSAAKSTQMNNRMNNSSSSRIIDELLKSIHKKDDNVSQEGTD